MQEHPTTALSIPILRIRLISKKSSIFHWYRLRAFASARHFVALAEPQGVFADAHVVGKNRILLKIRQIRATKRPPVICVNEAI